jgi:hypothetical protein
MSAIAWRAIGASVMGLRHKRDDKPCQDYWGYRALSTGEFAVAVADGAGSAPLAAEGAQAMVENALAAIATIWERYQPTSRQAWRGVIAQAFQIAQQRLGLQAAAAGQPPRAYAATLLVAIVSQDLVVCGLVGDCAAVVAMHNGERQSLCRPQRGEYANTTYFATHHNLGEHLDVQLVEGRVRTLALLTDGLLPLALNIELNQPFVPFFDPLFAFAAETTDGEQATQALAAFLDSERVNQRTHDDKTLVLITRLATDA